MDGLLRKAAIQPVSQRVCSRNYKPVLINKQRWPGRAGPIAKKSETFESKVNILRQSPSPAPSIRSRQTDSSRPVSSHTFPPKSYLTSPNNTLSQSENWSCKKLAKDQHRHTGRNRRSGVVMSVTSSSWPAPVSVSTEAAVWGRECLINSSEIPLEPASDN